MKCWRYQQLCKSSYHNKFGIFKSLAEGRLGSLARFR